MTFVIIILIIIFLGIVGASAKKPTRKSRRPEKERKQSTSCTPLPKVSELVKNVNTIDEFNQFERQQSAVFEKFNEDFDNKHYNRLYNIYESAYAKVSDKIGDKVFYYQYVPQLELETPLKHLNIAYKVLSPEEYSKSKRGTNDYEWNEINGNALLTAKLQEYIKEQPPLLASLINYRQIVESKNLFEEKVTAMVKLIKTDDGFRNEYFGSIKNFDTQCRVLLLTDWHIPAIELLIENGYNTPAKIKGISKEKLASIKGFGEKRITKFLEAVEKQH